MEVSKSRLVILALVLLIGCPLALAQPQHVISNSADWKDVYSTTLYANLQNIPNSFLTSARHSTIILYSISTSKSHVQAITSSETPFIVGYESVLRSRGYEQAEELIFDNVNLELAKLLAGIHRFIIVDDAHGYNALSAAPYAAAAGYYVLFANDVIIDDVSDFLSDHGVDDLIILGQVDREVRDELAQFNPEIINAGDRFDNNVAMTKKYLTYKNKKQTILTNGEFIEAGIMSGEDPVLFIGRTNVPDKIRDFIQSSDIDVGILVGNELIGSATFVRRQIGISVFVKFAQGARTPTGPIAQVEDLDKFPMPRFELDLSVESVVYNKATGQLELTYSNNVDIGSYVKSTLTVTLDDGSFFTFGDEDSIFIDGGDLKTVTYQIDLPADTGGNVSIFGVYGEAPESLENTLEAALRIDFVELNDKSAINITDLYYDKGKGKFFVEIENTGKVTAYVDVELIDLRINEEKVTISADDVYELKPGEKIVVEIEAELDEEDLLDNAEVLVQGRYGERKLALIKVARARFDLESKGGVDIFYYVLIAVIIILLYFIFFRGGGDSCPNCGKKGTMHDTPKYRVCTSCKHRVHK